MRAVGAVASIRSRSGGVAALISHGTIEERYGLDTAIGAVALLRTEIPELELKIYGDGTDRGRLRRLAASLGVADRVHFSDGFVPFDELPHAVDPPSGCHFRTRCWKATEVCAVDVPRFSGDPDHTYACHHPIETPVELGDAPLPV